MSLCQLLVIFFSKNVRVVCFYESNIFISRNTEKKFTFYRIMR